MARRRRRNDNRLAVNKRKVAAEALASALDSTGTIMASKDISRQDPGSIEIKEEDLEEDRIDDGEEYIIDCPISKVKKEEYLLKKQSVESNVGFPAEYEMYVVQGMSNTNKQFIVKPANAKDLCADVIQEKETKQQNYDAPNIKNFNSSLLQAKYDQLITQFSTSPAKEWYKRKFMLQHETFDNIKPSSTTTVTTDSWGNLNNNSLGHSKTLMTANNEKDNMGKKRTNLNHGSGPILTNDSDNSLIQGGLKQQQSRKRYQHDKKYNKRKFLQDDTTPNENRKLGINAETKDSQDNLDDSVNKQKSLHHNTTRGNKRRITTDSHSNLNQGTLKKSKPIIHDKKYNKQKSLLQDNTAPNKSNESIQLAERTDSNEHLSSINTTTTTTKPQDTLEETNIPLSKDNKDKDLKEKQVVDNNEGLITTTTTSSGSFHDNWFDDDLEQGNSSSPSAFDDFFDIPQKKTMTSAEIANKKILRKEAERNRRQQINVLLNELSSLLPPDSTTDTAKKKRSKCKVHTATSYTTRKLLIRACDYIRSMHGIKERLQQSLTDNEILRLNNKSLQNVLQGLLSKVQCSNQELCDIVIAEDDNQDT